MNNVVKRRWSSGIFIVVISIHGKFMFIFIFIFASAREIIR